MKIQKISNQNQPEKGNYTDGPAQGHLDTQLFPESEGTKYDRNIVKKTIENRKKSKIAARTKKMIGVDAFKGEGNINKLQWDDIFADAKDMYKQMKDTMSSDSNSQFWNNQFVTEEIVKKLIELGADESTAKLAIQSIIAMDSKFRKSPKMAATLFKIKTATQAKKSNQFLPNYNEENDNKKELELGKTIKYEDGTEKAQPQTNSEQFHETVNVIYSDYPNKGSHTEFEVPIPPIISSSDTHDILDYVWRQTNRVDGTEWIHNQPYRSSMVGDVYIVKGENWVVLGIGFAKLPISIEDWLVIPNKWSFFKEEQLRDLVKEAFTRTFIKEAQKNIETECLECKLKK